MCERRDPLLYFLSGMVQGLVSLVPCSSSSCSTLVKESRTLSSKQMKMMEFTTGGSGIRFDLKLLHRRSLLKGLDQFPSPACLARTIWRPQVTGWCSVSYGESSGSGRITRHRRPPAKVPHRFVSIPLCDRGQQKMGARQTNAFTWETPVNQVYGHSRSFFLPPHEI